MDNLKSGVGMKKGSGLLCLVFLSSYVVLAQKSEMQNDSLSASLKNSITADSTSLKALADSAKVDSVEKVKVKSAYQLFLLGLKSYREKDFIDAISFYNDAMSGIDDKRIYLYRGKAFLCAGNYENAIRDFMQYNRYVPNGASWELARTYAAMKSPGIAIEHLKNHLGSPYRQRWSVIMKDSLITRMQGDPIWTSFTDKQILSEAEKAGIEAEKKIKGNFYREALNAANSAVGYEPKNPDWYSLRANIYVEMGNFDEALKDYKKELSLAPHRENEVYKNIAFMYVRKRDLKTAASLLNEIVKNDPFEFPLLLDVAEIEKERYNTSGAMKAINRYLKLMPDDDEAYFLRAGIVQGDEAKEDINKAIALRKANKRPVPREYYMIQSSTKK